MQDKLTTFPQKFQTSPELFLIHSKPQINAQRKAATRQLMSKIGFSYTLDDATIDCILAASGINTSLTNKQ